MFKLTKRKKNHPPKFLGHTANSTIEKHLSLLSKTIEVNSTFQHNKNEMIKTNLQIFRYKNLIKTLENEQQQQQQHKPGKLFFDETLTDFDDDSTIVDKSIENKNNKEKQLDNGIQQSTPSNICNDKRVLKVKLEKIDTDDNVISSISETTKQKIRKYIYNTFLSIFLVFFFFLQNFSKFFY